MKNHTIFSFAVVALTISSCCEPRDLFCPGGDVIKAELPYSNGEKLVFESSKGGRFSVVFGNPESETDGFEYTTSCSMPRKEVECRPERTITGTIVDSNDVLAAYELTNFQVSIWKIDGLEKENYQLGFWGNNWKTQGGLFLTNYGISGTAPSFDASKFQKVSSYTTGEKNFTNVYILSEQEKAKSIEAIYDESGQLIALFNINDSSWYYLQN